MAEITRSIGNDEKKKKRKSEEKWSRESKKIKKKGENPCGNMKAVGSIQKWKLRLIRLTDQRRSSLFHSQWSHGY